MQRKAIVALVAGLLAFLAFAAWYDLTGHRPAGLKPSPTSVATEAPTDAPAEEPKVDPAVVEANRTERTGASWSPRDPVGEDDQPLTLGRAVPGAFEPIRAGMSIQQAVNSGFIERDPQREQSCEGTYWKWTGQLSEGLDIIVGEDKQVASLGMSRNGLETPEGISIGNSYAALKETYGDRLQGPERMDYGQAGLFLRDGQAWIGFGFDNQAGQLVDTSRIAFIEVSRGTRPGLIRDGC